MQQMSASRTTTKCAPKLKNSTLQPSGGTTIRLRFCSRRSRREHFVFSNTRSGPEPIFHRPNRNRFSMYSITSRVSRRRSWSSISPAAGGLPHSSGQAPPYHRPKCYETTRGARKRARRLLSSANMAGIGCRAASALQANGHGVGARIFGRRSLDVTSPREKQSERLSCG